MFILLETIVIILLQHGANPMMRSFAGETPLSLALTIGRQELLQALHPPTPPVDLSSSTGSGGRGRQVSALDAVGDGQNGLACSELGDGESGLAESLSGSAIGREFLITGRDEVWIARPTSPAASTPSPAAAAPPRRRLTPATKRPQTGSSQSFGSWTSPAIGVCPSLDSSLNGTQLPSTTSPLAASGDGAWIGNGAGGAPGGFGCADPGPVRRAPAYGVWERRGGAGLDESAAWGRYELAGRASGADDWIVVGNSDDDEPASPPSAVIGGPGSDRRKGHHGRGAGVVGSRTAVSSLPGGSSAGMDLLSGGLSAARQVAAAGATLLSFLQKPPS
mmetsp:Transcript_79978/g.214047  ORF Transcript_79978/g.214047 Transcript_79978/m.214047 type:complete len:334 (+) Transcript_79978:197-1198(+)